jgi:glycosidase
LGTNETLINFSRALHDRGMKMVFDAVFNHVGRQFVGFADVHQYGRTSTYANWFHNLNFDQPNHLGDPFSYEGWAGHLSLVKLNLHEQQVREYIFNIVKFWIDTFDVDGLRLDAADVMDHGFLHELATRSRQMKSDFWLMGEVVHGEYNHWANPHMLDSTTNYEAYKGLYSSHVDRNYFEIAHSLDRQFGNVGVYRDLMLYSFVDNHDVNRVASMLNKAAHLYPLYGLMFTMPGVPSIYYGSEWGIGGKRSEYSDKALRPALVLHHVAKAAPHPHLTGAIRQLAAVRRYLPALRYGTYRQLIVKSEQLVFERKVDGQTVIVAVNATDDCVDLTIPDLHGRLLRDALNQGRHHLIKNGVAEVELYPNWLHVFVLEE